MAMSAPVTLEQVAALVAQLTPSERRELVEGIVRDLVGAPPEGGPPRRRLWREIRGIVAYPLLEEDAQAWVSRTRREGDEQRAKQWRRTP
jgi:hypothetical protein